MILRLPCASRLSHLPFIHPCIPDAYFWLVVMWKIVDCQPPKAKACLIRQQRLHELVVQLA
jgi:hypothetical protein